MLELLHEQYRAFLQVHFKESAWKDIKPLRVPRPGQPVEPETPQIERDPKKIAAFFGGGRRRRGRSR